MKKIIIGIGIPCSGKTTTLKSFAEKNNYVYICPDDIRLELTGDAKNQSKNKEVWDLARERVIINSKENKTSVFDATFTNISQRKEFISFVRSVGYNFVQGVFADVDIDLAKERNKKRERVVPEYVIENMHKNLQENIPKAEDGFDTIFTVDEFQKLTQVQKME